MRTLESERHHRILRLLVLHAGRTEVLPGYARKISILCGNRDIHVLPTWTI